MFDKLEDLIHHYEELMNLLSEPDVANDANRFKKLMKEQSDLAPIVETYKKYKCDFISFNEIKGSKVPNKELKISNTF